MLKDILIVFFSEMDGTGKIFKSLINYRFAKGYKKFEKAILNRRLQCKKSEKERESRVTVQITIKRKENGFRREWGHHLCWNDQGITDQEIMQNEMNLPKYDPTITSILLELGSPPI